MPIRYAPDHRILPPDEFASLAVSFRGNADMALVQSLDDVGVDDDGWIIRKAGPFHIELRGVVVATRAD